MKRSTKIRLFVYLLTFVVPALSVVNCSGWNSGSMSVSHCHVNYPYAVDVANTVIGLLFISAFLIFIPVILYILGVWGVTELALKPLKKREHRGTVPEAP